SEAERGGGRDRGPGREPPLPCRLHAKPRRALLSRRLLRVGRRGPAGARAERQLPRSGAPRHDARRTGDRPHQGIVDSGVAGPAPAVWGPGGAAAYAVLGWLLAGNLLGGPLEGSDWPNTLAFADWMSRSFPAIPFWFPYQGGGVSPSAGYAIAPIYLIAG